MFSTQLSGSVIGTPGSFQNRGMTIDKVFDEDLDTYFDGSVGNNQWVGIDLGSPKVISFIQFAPRKGWSQRMVGGVFQGSNTADFSSGVVPLLTIGVKPNEGMTSIAVVSNTDSYRYVRYLSPLGGYGNIAFMRVFGSGITIPTPPAQNAPTPTPKPPAKTRGVMGVIAGASVRENNDPNGRILYDESAAAAKPILDFLKNPPIRWWQSFKNAKNGDMWYDSIEVYKRVAQYNGTKNSMCTVTPSDTLVKTNFNWDDVRLDIVASQVTQLPNNMIIALFNESNHKKYSPHGDLKGAARAAVREAPKFRVRGHRIGGPSITYGNPGGAKSLLESIRDEYKELDVVCASIYDTHSKGFLEQCKVWREFADSIGKKLAFTEWGWAFWEDANLSDERWAGELPEMLEAISTHADFSYFYMYTKPSDGTPAKWVRELDPKIAAPYADIFDKVLMG